MPTMDDDTPTGKFPHVVIMPPPTTAGGSSDTAACIMDPRTRETSQAAVSGAAYMHASCLHAAGGWLLMLSASSGKPYLTEPRTGRRVDLPAVPLSQHTAAFPVVRGAPDVVALFDRNSRHPHVLVSRISDDGAGEWASYMYPNTRECGAFKYGEVVGDEVWYVDAMGKAVALDLRGGGGGHWRVLCADGWGRRNVGRGRQFFLVADSERDGSSSTVARIHCPPPCYGEFRFSRLDGRGGEWVPLTEEELQGTSWFLFGQRCFVARGVDEGKKVYLLSPDDEKREGVGGPTRVLRPVPAVRHGNVYVHDLDAGTSEPLLSDPYWMTAQFWVHPDYF